MAISQIKQKLYTTVNPTGIERFFDHKDIIVSKTNLKGNIIYSNKTFLEIAGFTETEILGSPHSIVRHPEMPRCIFKVLWDNISHGKEVFAYVVNMAKNGDHYWVIAHVTPSKNTAGEIIGYHSNRRVPDREKLNNTIIPLYKKLLSVENKHNDRKAGLQTSHDMLMSIIQEKRISYDEFILTI